jgi:hypothetical protein
MRYFWNRHPHKDFPPPPILLPEEISPSDRLNIACTQTELSAYRQKKLVLSWCELLPTLDHVKYLWLSSRVPQSLFDAACQVPGLESLWVKWSGSGITTIEAVTRAKELRYFHLGSSTSLQSIEPLADMRQLLWLGLENVKRIRALDPIGGLTRLEGLTVEGSMWTTQHVNTLAPISGLSNLRYLNLANLRSDDQTLAPLFALQRLETFIAAQWWDPAEVEEIHRRNPGLAVQ